MIDPDTLQTDRERHLFRLLDLARYALIFYSDPSRYEGPNQRLREADDFTPPDASYRQDVTRDGGLIARAALASTDPVTASTDAWTLSDAEIAEFWPDVTKESERADLRRQLAALKAAYDAKQ